VFTRENGEPLRPEYVTRRFGELAAAAGLRKVRLHDLRHGAASMLLSAGLPMFTVMVDPSAPPRLALALLAELPREQCADRTVGQRHRGVARLKSWACRRSADRSHR